MFEKTKINEKEAGIGPFFRNALLFSSGLHRRDVIGLDEVEGRHEEDAAGKAFCVKAVRVGVDSVVGVVRWQSA